VIGEPAGRDGLSVFFDGVDRFADRSEDWFLAEQLAGVVEKLGESPLGPFPDGSL